MKPTRLRLLFWIGVAACFLAAGISMRSHPAIAIIALVAASLVIFLRWNRARDTEGLLVADRNGDVEALRRIAKRMPPASVSALVALAIFEGTAYVEAMPEHEICRCDRPNCPIHFLNDEMQMFLTTLRDSEDGRWNRHFKGMTEHSRNMPTTGVHGQLAGQLNWLRACCMSFGLLHGGGGRTRADVEGMLKPSMSRNVLGGAVRFAAALRLKQLGEINAAKMLLASLPRWKSGSRLAKEREELERELA